jgi:hypothetical protein
MQFLKNLKFFSRIVRTTPQKQFYPPLGRWGLSYGEDALRKADMTNEDHCGLCGDMREKYLREIEDKLSSNNVVIKTSLK